MSMRLMGGELSGRKIDTPEGMTTRPTLVRVRKSLMTILLPDLAGAQVLDLFAGAGTLGFEALSRGAKNAVLVENHPQAAAVLKKNIATLKLENSARLVRRDVLEFLTRFTPEVPFDVVLLDPPYGEGLAEATLACLAERPEAWLTPDALVVAQVGSDDPLEERYGSLQQVRSKRYGQTRIDFFELSS